MSDNQTPNAYPDSGTPAPGAPPPTGNSVPAPTKPTPAWTLLFVLIPVAFFLIGAVNLYYDYDVMVRYVETDGKVLDTEIDEHWSTSGTGRHRRRTLQYRPIIRYSYAVDGKTYQGDRYTRAKISSGSRSYATNALAKYPKGSACKVYYDPDKPADSVLIKKFAMLFVLFALIGGVLTLVLGIALPLQFIRSRTGQSQQFGDTGGGASVGGAPY